LTDGLSWFAHSILPFIAATDALGVVFGARRRRRPATAYRSVVLTDYHMHLQPDGVQARERDARRWETHGGARSLGWIGRYVERARARAIDEIAITEHVHRFIQARDWHPAPFWRAEATEDLDAHVADLRAAQDHGLPVLVGIEMDIVLGSVHWLGEHGIDDPEDPAADHLGAESVWDRYLDEFVAAAESGLFDVMAHPDLPKVFGHVIPPGLERRIDDVVAAIAEAGVAIECSSAGLRKPIGAMYPDPDLLARFARAGVPVTLASDAHTPEDVGRDYATVVAAIRGAGYSTLTRYRGREPRQEPIA
jgi:histidinol-phosphatase (PHP family)